MGHLILKLHNEIKTVEIGGHPVRAGRLTVAAACEIEAFLQTLESPLQFIDAKILAKAIPEADCAMVADIIMQRSQEWPPDAIGALCSVKMLQKAVFARVFIGAMIRAYNPHYSPEKVDEITNAAVMPYDALTLQPIALGVNTDPKDGAGLGVASNPPNESNGAGLSQS